MGPLQAYEQGSHIVSRFCKQGIPGLLHFPFLSDFESVLLLLFTFYTRSHTSSLSLIPTTKCQKLSKNLVHSIHGQCTNDKNLENSEVAKQWYRERESVFTMPGKCKEILSNHQLFVLLNWASLSWLGSKGGQDWWSKCFC